MALAVRDVATGWLDGYPAGSNCEEEVVAALQHLAAPTEKVGSVASDYAQEYISACKGFVYRHKTSTPGTQRSLIFYFNNMEMRILI